MTPAAGKLLVRPVQTPETLRAGQIVLTQDTREAWMWGHMEVLAVGAPGFCDDPDCERPHVSANWPRCHPNSVTVGDWVLVKPRALSETLEDGVYVCQQDDVLAQLFAD